MRSAGEFQQAHKVIPECANTVRKLGGDGAHSERVAHCLSGSLPVTTVGFHAPAWTLGRRRWCATGAPYVANRLGRDWGRRHSPT